MKTTPGGLLAIALGWSTMAHAEDPWVSFRWLDLQGTRIVSPHNGGGPTTHTDPKAAQCTVHQLQFGADGVRIRDCRDRYLATKSDDAVGFHGVADGSAGLFAMIRHRDGTASFQAHDGTLLYRDETGIIRRKSMEQPAPESVFTVVEHARTANTPGSVPLDCSPERIETIRSRYAQLAGKKNLKTLNETHDQFGSNVDSRVERGHNAHQREEHIVQSHEHAGFERFAYFWDAGDVPFFVYEIHLDYDEDQRVELRTYYDGTTPCRCLRKVGTHSLDHDPASFAALPDHQVRCQ